MKNCYCIWSYGVYLNAMQETQQLHFHYILDVRRRAFDTSHFSQYLT